jgi:hypothetical protein
MKIREHNLETNEIIDRDATDKEIAEFESIVEKEKARAQAAAQAAAAKAALLAKLGITQDEAKLLLS